MLCVLYKRCTVITLSPCGSTDRHHLDSVYRLGARLLGIHEPPVAPFLRRISKVSAVLPFTEERKKSSQVCVNKPSLRCNAEGE